VRPPFQQPRHIAKQHRSSQALLARAHQFAAAGAFDEAAQHFQRAVEADRTSPLALAHAGEFYFRQHKPEQALPLFVRVTKLEPKNAAAWRNLGVSHASIGEYEQAAAAFQRAVILKPDYPVAHHSLALALIALQRPYDAISAFQASISLNPQDQEVLYNFANTLVSISELDAAEAAFQLAVSLKPDFADAHCNLGKLYLNRNDGDAAVMHLRHAVSLNPDAAIPHKNLGAAYQHQGRLTEALACYETAVRIDPTFAEAISNAASLHLAMGNIEEASAAYRYALKLAPHNAATFSDLLFCLQNDHTISDEALFNAHREFAAHFEAPLRPGWPQHANDRDPNRRLRIGYVSGDLRNHAVAFFLEPLLANRDSANFEVHVYSNHAQVDAVTKRLATYVDAWTSCTHLSDDALAQRIRKDQIDILVDLSSHTAHNRLLTFARKPAPVQVTYIGYGGTTGLDAMDYRITDCWLDPVGVTDHLHSEELVRLTGGGAAFDGAQDAPDIDPLPALNGKGIMLACLNNPRKIRPPVTALWSRILTARPDATLMLGSVSDQALRNSLLTQFAENGIAASRITFQPWMPMHDYLALHNQIDLALDPFPYNGGTTSYHSLWMGVPFVTLAGNRTMSRVGACLLTTFGLDDWIADREDTYVGKVLSALADLPALDRLRRSLRRRIAPAGVNRSADVTASLESAYRSMWKSWCHAKAQDAPGPDSAAGLTSRSTPADC